ncbi:hypothetical protein ACUNV4_28130 [Granulosicoccus sp. 3-233]|uniref:hypothetical protein n=1 Tax=Granulosicoccus sp. 3-233 TaxID=3417969 RepID=UPI003D33A71D
MPFHIRTIILFFVLSTSACSISSTGNTTDSSSTPVNEISGIQDFFIHLKNGDEFKAYAMFGPSVTTRNGSRDKYRKFVQQNGLMRLQSWQLLQGSESSAENVAYNRNAIYEVVDSNAEKRVIGLNYDKPSVRIPANSTMVVLNSAYIPVETPSSIPQGDRYAYAPALPSGIELHRLLKSTTLLFAISVEAFSDSLFARDFKDFTDSVSGKFVHRGSANTIGYQYRYMYDQAGEMHELSKTSDLVITSGPQLREDGTFDVQLAFADEPDFGFVDQRYIHDGFDWKIMEIDYKAINGK